MRDIAKEVYEKMRVGNSAWIKPVAAKGDTLPSFQAVHDQVKQMADDGLISVSKIERQEDGLIDAIRIQKLARQQQARGPAAPFPKYRSCLPWACLPVAWPRRAWPPVSPLWPNLPCRPLAPPWP